MTIENMIKTTHKRNKRWLRNINSHVLGNVYGGGNEGPVGGNSEVKIQNQP